GQRVAARRDVRGYGIERADNLAETDAWAHFGVAFRRHLRFGIRTDVGGSRFHGIAESGSEAFGRCIELRLGDTDRLAFERIKLAGVFEQSLVAALAHCFEDGPDDAFRFFEPGGLS